MSQKQKPKNHQKAGYTAEYRTQYGIYHTRMVK
jgi:hypothetical protein